MSEHPIRRRLLSLAAALAFGFVFAPGAQAAKAIVPPGPPGADAPPSDFAALAARLLPMVVNISTEQVLKRSTNGDDTQIPNLPKGSPLQDFFNDFLNRGPRRPRRVTSLGSGFVIDPSGLVVTNNHVIEDADQITVILNDGTELPATLVGTDVKTDLALLRVKPRKPLVAAKLGDSDKARVGQWVVAIGNPFGLGGTVTAGIISARNRNINAGDYDDFIQTDASINRGNSGGPLFNMQGEVIGINSAIYSPTGGSVGIGFAIPSDEARSVLNQLAKTGKVSRGMIGVRIQQVTQEIADSMGLPNTKGALVAGVTDGGPADKGGIEEGDVIVGFDGHAVPDDRALPRIVAETTVGKKVNVDVIRKGQKRMISLVVGKLPDDKTAATAPAPKPGPSPTRKQSARLGLLLEPMSQGLRDEYDIARTVNGVVVTGVDPAGAATDKVREGDVIVEVARQKVTTPQQVEDKIEDEVKAGHTAVLLLVNHRGQETFVGVRVK